MEKLNLNRIAELSNGRCASPFPKVIVGNVNTDSREIQSGDLFVALKGERFNGHDFLDEAERKGAVAAMVEFREMKTRKSRIPLVLVDDVLAGFQTMARNYRGSFPIKAVAIAGSNGKTGTKEMVSEVLSTRFSVLKSRGNLNNHIGVPLSLMRLERSHELGVFEVGTNHPGELPPLLDMVQPIAGVITLIGDEHLEYFHDLEGVAREEGSVAEILPREGLLVLNADDEWSLSIARRCKARVTQFGLKGAADYRATSIEVSLSGTRFKLVTPKGSRDVKLRVMGRHQVSNALAAVAAGEFFGLDLDQICLGLQAVKPTKMRMEPHTTSSGVLIINDAYNANPGSVRAALEVMQELPVKGRRIAVLGEMLELGKVSEQAHRTVGQKVAESHMDVLVVIGKNAKPILEGAQMGTRTPSHIEFFPEAREAGDFLKSFARLEDVVLLKASRGVRLEQILEDWN